MAVLIIFNGCVIICHVAAAVDVDVDVDATGGGFCYLLLASCLAIKSPKLQLRKCNAKLN